MTYLTMKQAADHLPGQPTPDTVRRHCASGDLRGVFDGRRWYTTPEALEEFLQRKTRERLQARERLAPLVCSTAESVIEKYRRKGSSRK